jgi:hypothetical protein
MFRQTASGKWLPPTLLQQPGQQHLRMVQRPRPARRRSSGRAAAAAEAEAASLEEQPTAVGGSSDNTAASSTSARDAAAAVVQVRGALVEVQDMVKHFSTRRGLFKAVNGVSVTMEPGTITALLGPSGSGEHVNSCPTAALRTRFAAACQGMAISRLCCPFRPLVCGWLLTTARLSHGMQARRRCCG